MKSKYREKERDGRGDPHCDEDGLDAVDGGDGAHHEALAESEDPQQDQVEGRRPPGGLHAGEGDHHHHHHADGHVVQPRVGSHEPAEVSSIWKY